MKNIFLLFSTLGPLGYLPAPGTVGTIATLPLVYALHALGLPTYAQLLLVVLFALAATAIVHRAGEAKDLDADPGCIILDEVVGCLITFVCVPFSLYTAVLGFILFRTLDIVKPFGISKLEYIKGAPGIVLDDVIAGVMSNVALRLIIFHLL